MDSRYLSVYKIRLALVPLTPRDPKVPPLNVFFMSEKSTDPSQPSDDEVVETYVTGDFPNDRAIENYSREIYDKVKRGGKNEHLILHPNFNPTPKRVIEQEAEPEPGPSVPKKRGSGARARTPKTKPKKQMKETKKLRIMPSRVKAPKNENLSEVERVLRAHQIRVTPTASFSFLASLAADIPYGRCHPEALMYRLDFQEKKMQLCQKLFKFYNEEVFDNKLPQDLQMTWSKRLKKSAGITHNRHATNFPEPKPRSSRIVFSIKVCDSADRLRDTLIHELCHAACWLVDKVRNGHGNIWKFWANKAMTRFPELRRIHRCHNYEIFFMYSYKCARCGYTIGRHSKSLDTATKRCGYCYGVFELFVNTKRASGAISRRKIRN